MDSICDREPLQDWGRSHTTSIQGCNSEGCPLIFNSHTKTCYATYAEHHETAQGHLRTVPKLRVHAELTATYRAFLWSISTCTVALSHIGSYKPQQQGRTVATIEQDFFSGEFQRFSPK